MMKVARFGMEKKAVSQKSLVNEGKWSMAAEGTEYLVY